MNKIVNQERDVNLFEGARKIVSKLGPRNLAATLMLSSMLALTGCGKNDEVTQQNVAVENNDDVKYRNRALGGKIVDNHNGELYISKASDLESVVNSVNNTESNTKTSNGSKKENTTSTTTTITESNVVDNNTSVEVPAPNLMPGETVTYFPDGSYVVEPSQEYVNPQEDNTPPTTDEPSTDVPSTEQPSDEEQVPPVVEENKGYVVLKKNYPDDTYFYVFTNNNGSYNVQLIDVNYANGININSNIYALAADDEAYAYALNNNWVGVGPYNFENWSVLDSVYNMEQLCDELVTNALKEKEEADKNAAQGLGLGLQ